MLPNQLDFFKEVTTPSTSVVGLRIFLQSECAKCGSRNAIVGSSKGPHHAALYCADCNLHRGWMYGEAYDFLGKYIDQFGRPASSSPIVVRQPRGSR